MMEWRVMERLQIQKAIRTKVRDAVNNFYHETDDLGTMKVVLFYFPYMTFQSIKDTIQ
jgi:hypothetical protein